MIVTEGPVAIAVGCCVALNHKMTQLTSRYSCVSCVPFCSGASCHVLNKGMMEVDAENFLCFANHVSLPWTKSIVVNVVGDSHGKPFLESVPLKCHADGPHLDVEEAFLNM